MKNIAATCWLIFSFLWVIGQDPLKVKPTADFILDGKGTNAAWEQTAWVILNKIDPGAEDYISRFKILYSSKGIYVLFSGVDHQVTSTYNQDFDDLYNADVFEAFFHPEPQLPVYFEYEINALDRELVLLIPNVEGKIMGWRPWHYEQDRKVIHQVHLQKDDSGLQSWTAECFFPYTLLAPLQNVPPAKGMIWKANFCRLDYDSGKMIKWAWSPIKVSFHEFAVYRSIQFD